MAKICPETGDVVLYLECLECDTKCTRDSLKAKEEKEERE